MHHARGYEIHLMHADGDGYMGGEGGLSGKTAFRHIQW